MKKILIAVLLVVALIGVAYAGQKTLTFAWSQPGSMVGFAGWKLYQSDVAGLPGVLAMTIPYGGTSQTEYTGTKILTSPDGQTKTYYFTLTAFDTSANESAKSNEVSAVIDFESPSVPVTLKVTITN
jgi:hypothetical protein